MAGAPFLPRRAEGEKGLEKEPDRMSVNQCSSVCFPVVLCATDELGHLFGCKHDRANVDDPGTDYAYGKLYCDGRPR